MKELNYLNKWKHVDNFLNYHNWNLDLYLLKKPFNFEELNRNHKNKMIEQYKRDKIRQEISGGYNTHYDNEEYNSIIGEAFLNIVQQNFEVSQLVDKIKTWIYVQNYQHWHSVWHTHVTTASVNAVFYIDPPKKGGGLNLRFNGIEHIIHPEPNILYIFPCWMEHRPLPQEDDEWRISVNIEYMCNQRPIVKETQIMW